MVKRNEAPTLKTHINNINTLVNLCLASSKIKKLTIEEEKGALYDMRPQLHLIMRAPTSSFKSTILSMIAKELGITVSDQISIPGLVGALDSKTGMVIPGAAWTHRNSMLLMDEFKFRRKSDDWIAFNKLLEDRKYSKKIGMFSSNSETKDGDLKFTIKDGEISMSTRFSAVVGTLKDFRAAKGEDFKAFVTRCMIYQYSFTMDELEYVLMGKQFIKVIKPKKFTPEIFVKWTKYRKLMKFSRKYLPNDNFGKENYPRCLGDIVRCHAITHNMNKRLYSNIIKWKLDAYQSIGSYYTKELRS